MNRRRQFAAILLASLLCHGVAWLLHMRQNLVDRACIAADTPGAPVLVTGSSLSFKTDEDADRPEKLSDWDTHIAISKYANWPALIVERPIVVLIAAYTALLAAILCLGARESAPFIYFQF